MKGIYVLAILVGKDIAVTVGALREVKFKRGFYFYVGSAQKNMERRIARHFRKTKRKFWHVDHLLGADGVSILRVFRKRGPKLEECRVAKRVGRLGIAIEGVRFN